MMIVPLTKFVRLVSTYHHKTNFNSLLRNYMLRRVLKPSPFHGIYEIFISLYIPTIYAAMSVLNCPSIPISDTNGTHYEVVSI